MLGVSRFLFSSDLGIVDTTWKKKIAIAGNFAFATSTNV